MKARLFLTEYGDVAQYIPDVTDVLGGNGAFILTNHGAPSSWWIGPNMNNLINRMSKKTGLPIGEAPPVITTDEDLIDAAREMFHRCFSQKCISKADRELSVTLVALRDKINEEKEEQCSIHTQ